MQGGCRERRAYRDVMRTRLRLVERRTAFKNSIERIFEKYNVGSEDRLSPSARIQLDCHRRCICELDREIKTLEQSLNGVLTSDADVQRLLWIPGIGRILALTILLEIDDISRFASVKQFYSYCRLVPGCENSGGKTKDKKSREGNRYLKLAFSHATINASYRRTLKRKCKPIARAIIAKELARIVFEVLRCAEPYDQTFKGRALSRPKSQDWPRLAPHVAC